MTGGTFSLILQQEIATDPLSFSSSTYTIVNALQAAANQLSDAECTSFGVSKTVSSDGTKMYLQITFNTDNSQPLTLMDVYTGELTGRLSTFSLSERLFGVSRQCERDFFPYPAAHCDSGGFSVAELHLPAQRSAALHYGHLQYSSAVAADLASSEP